MLTLGQIETVRRKPCLFLIAELPGTGNSTLAQTVAEQADFEAFRSGVVRKELVGVAIKRRSESALVTDNYTVEWTQHTYEECLRQAENLLFGG